MDFLNTVNVQDVLQGIPLPDKSINCTVTSVPYLWMRDYKIAGQLGLEPTVEEYLYNQVRVFNHVHRVTKDDGLLFVNCGDTYASSGGPQVESSHRAGKGKDINVGEHSKRSRKPIAGYKAKDLIGVPWQLALALRDAGSYDLKACRVMENVMNAMVHEYKCSKKRVPDKVLKVLQTIEEEYRQAKGSSWYLRQDIIWHKPNPMPESVSDRCTKSHEYIFMFSKSSKYFFDAFAISTPLAEKTLTTYGTKPKGYGDGTGLVASENWHERIPERKPKVWKTPDGWDTSRGEGGHGSIHKEGREKGNYVGGKKHAELGSGEDDQFRTRNSNGKKWTAEKDGRANKRTVWTVATEAYGDDHYATFPENLIVPCIKAGCPAGGTVMDPYAGRCTTAIVARKCERNYVMFDINPKDVKKGQQRITEELGLFQ